MPREFDFPTDPLVTRGPVKYARSVWVTNVKVVLVMGLVLLVAAWFALSQVLLLIALIALLVGMTGTIWLGFTADRSNRSAR